MHQDKDMAWQEFEQTGSLSSYLTYRGINTNPHATAQKKTEAEKPAPEKGNSLR